MSLKPKPFEKSRKVTATVVVAALVLAAFSYGIASVVVRQSPRFQLTSGQNFSITSTVYATYNAGSCTGASTAKLSAGSTQCLAVTVRNPLSVAMTVSSLSMTVSSFTATPSNHDTPVCTKTMVTAPTLFSSAFTIAPRTTMTIDKPITLTTSGGTQGNCENGTFHFSFSGAASYTDTTTTVLTASLSGSTGTLKATVSPANPSFDSNGPAAAPIHTVTFYSCGTTASCTSKSVLAATVPLTTATGNNLAASATHTVSGLSTAGTYYYEASYPATGAHTGTFAGSTSSIESITVAQTSGGGGGGGTVPPPSSGSTPPKASATTVVTGVHTGSVTVGNGKSVFLNGGTITGTVTVTKTATFAATGGTIRGNVVSTGGAVSLIGTRVDGSITVTGLKTSKAHREFGTAALPSFGFVQYFRKRLAATHICGTVIEKNLIYNHNSLPFEMGGSHACRSDVVHGSLNVASNTAPFLIVGNAVSGNVSVAGNKGGTLIRNVAGGTCSLGRNNPRVTGRGNTAKKANTCNASR